MTPFILNPTVEKKCSRCHIVKSISCFHKNKRTKDGHHFYCKDCIHELDRISWQKAHPRNTLPEERTCPCCGETKPIKDFIYLKGATGNRGGSKICFNCYYQSFKESAKNRANENADLMKYQKYYLRHYIQLKSHQKKIVRITKLFKESKGYTRKLLYKQKSRTEKRLEKLYELIHNDLDNIHCLQKERITKTKYK